MSYKYNNSNYWKEYRREQNLIKNIEASYNPPETYKNKKPTKGEFQIENIDIEKLKKLKDEHEKRTDSLAGFCGVWFLFGGIFSCFIATAFFKNSDKGYVFYAIWLIPILISFLLSLKKFEYDEIYKKYHDYEIAIMQYDWWQKRKRKNFWLSMSGRQFEIEVSNIFGKMGYRVEICKQGGDKGVDIKLSKDGKIGIVQCKAHKNKISPSVVRDLYGTKVAGNYDFAYLVTLNGATSGTMNFCYEHNIILWDLEDILKNGDL